MINSEFLPFLIHSKTPSFLKQVQKAEDIVKRCLDLGVKFSVSLSGGKDSVVVAKLVSKQNPKIKMVCHKDDFDLPDSKEYVQRLAKKQNWDVEIIEPRENLWGFLKQIEADEDIHSKSSLLSERFFYPMMKNWKEKNKIKGSFLGLRAEESKGRKMNFKTKGYIYYNQDFDELVCQPIANWCGKDVFAYLIKENIELHPVYFKTLFNSSDITRIREGWVLPGSQATQGKMAWLKYYYPDVYQKIIQIQPKLSTYA